MATDAYDVIIIGGGSAAVSCAVSLASSHGAHVALVERRLGAGGSSSQAQPGGTCVHEGCVANKLTWLTATRLSTPDTRSAPFDWDEARRRISAASLAIASSYKAKLEDADVVAISGEALHLAPAKESGGVHSVTVRPTGGGPDRTLTAPVIVLATGAHPAVPSSIAGAAELGHTSDDFYGWWQDETGRQRALPTVALVGAGHIAVELSTQLSALGSAVTMHVRPGDVLLEAFDSDVREAVAEGLHRGPFPLKALVSDFEVTAVTRGPPGRGEGQDASGQPATLYLASADGRSTGPFHRVYFVTGRAPNSTLAVEAGVQTAQRPFPPFVLTDPDTHETSVPGVYAIGDVASRVHLTPTAIFQGRRLARVLAARGALSHRRSGQPAGEGATTENTGTMAPFRETAGGGASGGGQGGGSTGGATSMKAGCAGGVGLDSAADVALRCENVPVTLLSYPPASFVGLTEELAVHKHGTGAIVVFEARPLPLVQRMTSSGEEGSARAPLRGLVKMICLRERESASQRLREHAATGGSSIGGGHGEGIADDPSKLQVVGLHLVGPGADEAIQGFAVAVTAGLTKADFDATLSVHPTFAEEALGLSKGRAGRAPPS